MNYKSIHDKIICRAKTRPIQENLQYESHHIIPKCEGGLDSGEQVLLTQKEHRLIHKLRYHITGVYGNYMAYNLMRYGREIMQVLHSEFSSKGGKAHHTNLKNKSQTEYSSRQRKSGILGGISSRDNKKGFHSLSDREMEIARNKGRNTLVQNKIGMFSDEYRKLHKKRLCKRVSTPNGEFESLTSAAKYHKISNATVTYRINNDTFPDWYIIETGEI